MTAVERGPGLTTTSRRPLLVALAVLGPLLVIVWLLTREPALYQFDESSRPQYESPVTLEDGGQLQLVQFPRGEERLALGVRSYPNPQSLTAEAWLRLTWDRTALIEIAPLRVRESAGIRIMDASRWLLEHEGETDFPAIVVLAVRVRIVVIDRVNGVEVEEAVALELIAGAER